MVYGRPRMTEDIDITVEKPASGTASLVEALSAAGFALRVQDVDDFVARTWVIPLKHLGTGIPVDVVLAGATFRRACKEADERQLPRPPRSGT